MPKMTSIEAYGKHVIEGKATSQRERIFRFILNETLHGRSVNRSQITEHFAVDRFEGHTVDGKPPIPLASVCGRVTALLDAGIVEVDKSGPGRWGRRVEYLKAVLPAPEQRKFKL